MYLSCKHPREAEQCYYPHCTDGGTEARFSGIFRCWSAHRSLQESGPKRLAQGHTGIVWQSKDLKHKLQKSQDSSLIIEPSFLSLTIYLRSMNGWSSFRSWAQKIGVHFKGSFQLSWPLPKPTDLKLHIPLLFLAKIFLQKASSKSWKASGQTSSPLVLVSFSLPITLFSTSNNFLTVLWLIFPKQLYLQYQKVHISWAELLLMGVCWKQ